LSSRPFFFETFVFFGTSRIVSKTIENSEHYELFSTFGIVSKHFRTITTVSKKIENLKHSKLFSTFQNDSEHFEIISNICKHQ